jgi:hypothetical protein
MHFYCTPQPFRQVIRLDFTILIIFSGWYQWPRGLGHWYAAAPMLGMRVRISSGEWKCCQVEVSTSADHSSSRVLPGVVCLSVIVKPRQWGGRGPWVVEPLKKIFSEEYKSLSPTINYFFPPPLNTSLLRPYVFLIIPFSTFSLSSIINVQDRVHTHINQYEKTKMCRF